MMLLQNLFAAMLVAPVIMSSPLAAHQDAEQTNRAIVESYTNAYNASDAAAMGRLMHDNIQWLTVKDDQITITVQGKADMLSGLKGYFKNPMKITSTLSGWGENGDYVSVIEIASWTAKSGEPRSQSSNVVYQIENGLIRRVWYFPEQKPSE